MAALHSLLMLRRVPCCCLSHSSGIYNLLPSTFQQHRCLPLPAPPPPLQFVGYSQDSRLPAEFDVSQLIRPGSSNVLALQVTLTLPALP